MCCPRLLCSVGIVALIFQVSTLTGKEKEKSPRDENARPAELVKIGLEAELAGNGPSRQLHLQAALDLNDDYAPAHWHLGDVRTQGE